MRNLAPRQRAANLVGKEPRRKKTALEWVGNPSGDQLIMAASSNSGERRRLRRRQLPPLANEFHHRSDEGYNQTTGERQKRKRNATRARFRVEVDNQTA